MCRASLNLRQTEGRKEDTQELLYVLYQQWSRPAAAGADKVPDFTVPSSYWVTVKIPFPRHNSPNIVLYIERREHTLYRMCAEMRTDIRPPGSFSSLCSQSQRLKSGPVCGCPLALLVNLLCMKTLTLWALGLWPIELWVTWLSDIAAEFVRWRRIFDANMSQTLRHFGVPRRAAFHGYRQFTASNFTAVV